VDTASEESSSFEAILNPQSSIQFLVSSYDVKCCSDRPCVIDRKKWRRYSEGAMSGEYGGCDRTSHLSVQNLLRLTGAATCGQALSCRRIILPGVIVGAFFFECSAQSHQLCSVENLSNGLIRFEQLIIHDTKLIPPNTQHKFFSMNIRLGCRCGYWSMARWSLWFPLFWIIVVDPFFITSDYTMQKTFVYAWQAAFHMWKIGV